MKKITQTLSVLLYVAFQSAFGQANTDRAVKIGEKVPDYEFKNLINYKTKTAKVSDFKGKLLILDVWATWCGPCIKGIQQMQALQQEFGDKIQIILVNYDEENEKVDRFIERRKNLPTKVILPVLYNDPLVVKTMFPPNGLPTCFWIDDDRVLRNKTNKLAVTRENIQAMLNGKSIYVSTTQKGMPSIPDDKNITWESKLVRDTIGFGPGFRMDVNKNGYSSMVVQGSSVIDLYRTVYGKTVDHLYRIGEDPIPVNRTIVDFACDKKLGRHRGNYQVGGDAYHYRLLAPPTTSAAELFAITKTDLEKWFGLTISYESREIEYLSLTCSDTTLVRYKSQPFGFHVDDALFEVVGTTLDQLLWSHALVMAHGDIWLPYLIVNDTGIKGKVSISVETDVKNYKALDKALSKYGLHLSLVKGKQEVLIIKQTDKI